MSVQKIIRKNDMKREIALIDFGAGNLHSVYKAFKFIGANIEITKDIKTIEKSDAVVFPGVGAFGSVMNSVKKNNLEEVVIKSAKSKKPFLGICVGMQVLFEEGEENTIEKGLGVFKGKVVKFKKARKVPHIGWNDVTFLCHPERSEGSPSVVRSFVTNVPQDDVNKFYFVHSYYVVPEDRSIICGETEYDGEKFVSMIKKDNLLAVQFHPEKSGDAGLNLLDEFLKNI